MEETHDNASHLAFTHNAIESLGYDWERVADPLIAPKYPCKVFFPQTTEEVVSAVQECRTLGQRLFIRSKGHSSNDLVLTDRGAVLVTQFLNRILQLNEAALTVKVQAGTRLAAVDQYLGDRGYGLPIIGDHIHITAGGFASVGGISPASHRYGAFIDNVESLEYVTWEGDVVACGAQTDAAQFRRVLAGTGQYGVIVTLTLKIIRIDKLGTVLKNDRVLYFRLNGFVEASHRAIQSATDCVMERGLWVDMPLPLGRSLCVGQFSRYVTTSQRIYKTVRNRMAYAVLHQLGRLSSALPSFLGSIFRYLTIARLVVSPRYASVKNVESFTDRVLDYTSGDPNRMLIAFSPVQEYAALFRHLYALAQEYRSRHRCFTFISLYVKAISSPYLAKEEPGKRYCELMLYVGINPAKMTKPVLDELVSRMDDLCIAHGAFRYMHSKTVKDRERRRRIDPNCQYAQCDLPSGSAVGRLP
jgi:hypothetical protein